MENELYIIIPHEMNKKGVELKFQARSSAKQERTQISATRAIHNHQNMFTSTSNVQPNEKREQAKHFLATRNSIQEIRFDQVQNKK
ncbi:hypothetical protein Lal_00023703 [Lupinus albus]|nr:hypothetical protein Lal_00023703 [Lupinus albus]